MTTAHRATLWMRDKRAERAQLINTLKANAPCADCKQSYPSRVMQFDHVRGKKVAKISTMITQPTLYDLLMLMDEIAKCDIVCANCHALRHNGT